MDEVVNMLRNGVVELCFVKKDGSVRVMRATLNAALFTYEHKGRERNNANVTCVWDMDKQAWRSFRNESLLSWEQE